MNNITSGLQKFTAYEDGKFPSNYCLIEDKECIRTFRIRISPEVLCKEFNNYNKKYSNLEELRNSKNKKKQKVFFNFEESIVKTAANDIAFSDKNITNITNFSFSNFVSSKYGQSVLEFDISFSYTKKVSRALFPSYL